MKKKTSLPILYSLQTKSALGKTMTILKPSLDNTNTTLELTEDELLNVPITDMMMMINAEQQMTLFLLDHFALTVWSSLESKNPFCSDGPPS